MAYHDFPWQKGSSRSFEKLLALSLPALQGKTVLDVGCNEGYFCGWAAFQKADYVHGIDINPAFIEQAKTWFPSCTFSCKDWHYLGQRSYDLILCLSAMHYAPDQSALIGLLMSKLAPDGVLVLEIGVADGEKDEFVPVKRSIHKQNDDIKFFPTMPKVHSMLSPYTFKYMGGSVMQSGDPIPRHVFHVQNKRPYAILLMDSHYAGKTSFCNAVFRPDIFKIHGELIYHSIKDGEINASDELKEHISYVEGTKHMLPPRITADICKNGLLPELAGLYCKLAGKRDFILEHYIPPAYREQMAELCEAAGYFVVDVAIFQAFKNNSWLIKRPPYKHYEAYLKYLEKLCALDEKAYLAAHPDVAQAIADGSFASAKEHYWKIGKRENRKLS